MSHVRFRCCVPVVFLACSHGAPPTPRAVVPETPSCTGKAGAPLPDGQYVYRRSEDPGPMRTIEVRDGHPRLVDQPDARATALAFIGPGPVWRLVAQEPGHDYSAELLCLSPDEIWYLPHDGEHGVVLSKAREVPTSLQGRWTSPGSVLTLTSSSLTVTEEGEKPQPLSVAWLRGGGGPARFLVTAEGEGGTVPAVEHDGLLGLFSSGPREPFVREGARPPTAPTLEQLQQQSSMLWAGGKAYRTQCQGSGCDFLPLGKVEGDKRFHLSVARDDEAHGTLRLRPDMRGGADALDLSLANIGDRVLALGSLDPVLLSPVSPADVPRTLLGTWRTSVIFPAEGRFDITEVRVATDRVETLRNGGVQPAFWVRSGLDQGLLLLAFTPSKAGWEIWRLTPAADAWYLSRWGDGAGPIALHQGSEPSFSPARALRATLDDFCDLERLRKRIAPFAESYATKPLVAVKSYAEDAEGRPRFPQLAVRRLFNGMMDVGAQHVPTLLGQTRDTYNLPQTPCPAVDDMVAHAQGKPADVPASGMDWWKLLDEGTRKAVVRSLNKMWAGALIYYESDHLAGDKILPKGFPGDARSHLTPDCCRPSACSGTPAWTTQEPWTSLDFTPPDDSKHLRFDFRSTGTESTARFVSVVAVDPRCTGQPLYFWRAGHINSNGDVTGTFKPSAGARPPELEPAADGK